MFAVGNTQLCARQLTELCAGKLHEVRAGLRSEPMEEVRKAS